MKKSILFTLAFMAIVGGIIGSLYMMNKTEKEKKEGQAENYDIADKVTDECIDEYNEKGIVDTEAANASDEEKLSPKAVIVFEKYYRNCEHTVSRYEEIDKSLVNCTKNDIEKKYTSWKVKDFAKDKVVLYQEVDGECNEHYMLKNVDGKINIYKLDENGNESLLDETDIATEYLTETDMIDMDNGLIVYGRESLNKLLEDFE